MHFFIKTLKLKFNCNNNEKYNRLEQHQHNNDITVDRNVHNLLEINDQNMECI